MTDIEVIEEVRRILDMWRSTLRADLLNNKPPYFSALQRDLGECVTALDKISK